ncbi:MAG TPA: OFA family MFS transporter [Streptosporangiaceae bacterium]|jgi:MFS family permease
MTTSPTADSRSYREVTDARGRVYRIGESDRSLLGHRRRLMVVLPWVAMMAISVFEYAYGSAEETLTSAHGWTSTNTFWILTVWVFFQAGVATPAGFLRERGILTARRAMLIGSVLSLIGFLSISHSPSVSLAILGFGVVGGLGAGLVYATCINMVGKWYPDNRGARTGFVNGGFAYGSLPFIVIFNYWFDTSNYQLVLDLIGAFVLVAIAICGIFFKDPPKNWWPEHIDPLKAAAQRNTTTALTKNPPAVKQYSPKEAFRTGMIPLMWVSLAFISGVSIFGISFEVPFAKDLGFGPLMASLSAGILAVVNGVGRAAVGWVSDMIGRKQTLIVVLIIEALAQFGTLWAGNAHNEPMFLVMAFVSGFGAGAFYPLFAALVPDFFGENHNATNYGIVYSAKLVSGLFGGGLGAIVIAAWGYTGAYTLAGIMGFVSAAMALLLRQPGRSSTPTPEPPT